MLQQYDALEREIAAVVKSAESMWKLWDQIDAHNAGKVREDAAPCLAPRLTLRGTLPRSPMRGLFTGGAAGRGGVCRG